MAALYKARAGQVAFEKDIDLHRISAFLTRRQYGKTTNAARIALKKMMRTAGHTVVFGSVKLDLGREIVRKESEQMSKAFQLVTASAASAKMELELADGQTGKILKPEDMVNKRLAKDRSQSITAADFAELYESQRLEFRLHHSKTIYSRTKVVALTPDAVGETGDLILDEVGRVKKFREVWEAVKPIISSNPDFRCLLTTTPPPDDTHYSFELLAPPPGWNREPNPAGHTYRTESGVFVRMVTAWDAAADGVLLYDDDRRAHHAGRITPARSEQGCLGSQLRREVCARRFRRVRSDAFANGTGAGHRHLPEFSRGDGCRHGQGRELDGGACSCDRPDRHRVRRGHHHQGHEQPVGGERGGRERAGDHRPRPVRVEDEEPRNRERAAGSDH